MASHPALRPWVSGITVDGAQGDTAPTPYRVLPGAAPVIGFQFRGRLSVRGACGLQQLGVSGITGLQSTARWFVPEAGTRSILVSLAPYGGYALLGLSMAELADRHVPLDRLVRGMSSIEERLAGIAPHEAIEIVQTWLLDRIQSRRREVHPDVVAATRRIAAGEGRERVEAVADAIGVGRRRLERLFRLQIGVGPKEFASLVRFGAVTSDLEGKSWADAALRGGYADQAHFIRDFKARTGLTPTQFRRHPA